MAVAFGSGSLPIGTRRITLENTLRVSSPDRDCTKWSEYPQLFIDTEARHLLAWGDAECIEYISIPDEWPRLNPLFLSSDHYQQLRRLCLTISQHDTDAYGLDPLKSLPQLKDVTITGLLTEDSTLKWLADLPNIANVRVTAKLVCPSKHILELLQRENPRIDHLEMNCMFPEAHYCQYRVVRFLGLIAKRTTINIPLVCERSHVEKLYCLREALALQETEEHLKRAPFENFVTLLPKAEVVVKEEPADSKGSRPRQRHLRAKDLAANAANDKR